MGCRILMIGPDPSVKGGISSVIKGYLNSELCDYFTVEYISSHMDGSKIKKFKVAVNSYFRFIYTCIIKKPKVVHIHTSFGASFYRKSIFVILCKLFWIPCINHIHGAEFEKFYTNASRIKKCIVRFIYSMCYQTIVLSEEWVSKIRDIIPNNKIVILHNFAQCPNEMPGVRERKNNVLFLGEIGMRKGAFDIPDIVSRVVLNVKDIKFIICGNGQKEKLERIVEERGIKQFVEIRDWVSGQEKELLLRESKIYFLPSYDEGLPMSILEGMAYGLPIVSTTVGGIPGTVINGENGFVFKPGSADEFAVAITSIINDEALFTSMSKANYEKIKRDYSLEISVFKLKQIYESIIAKRWHKKSEKVNIGGILFDSMTLKEACSQIECYINSSNSNDKVITVQAANVDSVVKSHINDDMKVIANKFDIILPDGMPVIWASVILGRRIKERVAGPDFFLEFNKIADKAQLSYFFLGSTDETLTSITKRISAEYPHIKIAGVYSPPFSDLKDEKENYNICQLINHSGADVVWVSFGCPKQERWIIDNKNKINSKLIMGIGAAFEFYAGTVKRAPVMLQKIGLEWFYRFIQEPKRLWRRYFVECPKFFYYVFKFKSKVLQQYEK